MGWRRPANSGANGTHYPGALGDYAASVDPLGYDTTTNGFAVRGAFQMGTGTRIEDFTDGTTNTVVICESFKIRASAFARF